MSYYVRLEPKYRKDEDPPWLELKKLIAADPECRAEGSEYVWTSPDGEEEAFSLAIGAKYPSDALLAKWAGWARALGMKIVGEDGTVYRLEDYLPEEEPAPKAKKKVKRAPVDYSPAKTYEAGDRIRHPKFGLGKVLEVRGPTIDVEFDGETKKLVHGRS